MIPSTADRYNDLGRCVRRVLSVQCLLAGTIALTVKGLVGGQQAWATLYGCLLGLINTLITARGARRSARAGTSASGGETAVSLLPAYLGMVNKLFVVAAGVALGAVVLRLHALYIVLGYTVLLAGYVACRPERI